LIIENTQIFQKWKITFGAEYTIIQNNLIDQSQDFHYLSFSRMNNESLGNLVTKNFTSFKL